MSPTSRIPLLLLSGSAHPALAEELSRQLKVVLVTAEVGAFADGETRVRVAEDVRQADGFIVQPTRPPVNNHLMVLALLADAVRAAGAARITATVPYFGYARQEQRSRPGDPRSAQVVGRLLGCVGVDHLVTLDVHAPALEAGDDRLLVGWVSLRSTHRTPPAGVAALDPPYGSREHEDLREGTQS